MDLSKLAWTSSDPTIATVENGVVTIHSVGVVTITAAMDEDHSVTCTITVDDPAMMEMYETMRNRWSDRMTGNDCADKSDADYKAAMAVYTEKASTAWESMVKKPDGEDDRTTLWEDLDLTINYPGKGQSNAALTADLNTASTRILDMARGWAAEGSELYHNEALGRDIVDALTWYHDHVYNENYNLQQIYGNWWHWWIGIPQDIGSAVILMYSELDKEFIDAEYATLRHFNEDPTKIVNVWGSYNEQTGANLADTSLVAALRSAIGNNQEGIGLATKHTATLTVNVTSGDGFYDDGSFKQHGNFAYSGSYGVEKLRAVTEISVLTNNTPWACTDADPNIVYEWILNGYRPLYADGGIFDMVQGRSVSRFNRSNITTGRYAMDAIIRLVDGAPEEYRDELLSFAKTQAMLGVAYDSTGYYNGMKSISSLVKVKNIVADESIPLDTEVYAKIYGSMDKAVVQGDGFALGVSMFSSRNGATECGNSENLKGWYQSDGVLELYNGDQAQHDKGYWATVDPLRLPGIITNHVTQDLAGFSIKTNDRDWVGGSTAGVENYASIGQDFKSNYSDLEGKKSWFAFGDQVVALGAGIQSTEGDTVETIVENRKTDNANQLLVNGKETLARSGGDHAPFGRAAGSGLVAAPAHIRPAHADHRVWLGAADDLVIAFPVVCLGFAVFAFAAGAVAPFPAGEGVHSKMSKGVKSHLLPGKLPGRGHNGNRLVNSVHGQGFLSLGMGWLHYSQGERRCAIGRICTLWGNFVPDTPDRLCGCFLPYRRFLPAKKPIKKQNSAYLRAAKALLLWVCNRESGPQGPLL